MASEIIRLARPSEYARVRELTLEVYVDSGLVSPSSPYVHTLADVADRAAKAELLVAEVDGRIAGTVAYCPPGSPYMNIAGPDEAEFRMLAVLPQARGNGIGRALVQECVDRARQAGLAILRISTQQNMLDAQRMYERMGFDRTPDHDWSPSPGVPLITYVLRL